MKKLKKFISLVAAAALLVMVPGGNVLTASAEEPAAYYVRYVAGDNEWRFQRGSSWDDNAEHRELYYMQQDIKDGDTVVIDGTGTLNVTLNARLGNLTLNNASTVVVTTNGIDSCYVLGSSVAAVNGDITNAYVYDTSSVTFNNSISTLQILGSSDINANVTVAGTVGHLIGKDNTTTYYDFYNVAAGKLVISNGTVKTEESYYSTTPSDTASGTAQQSTAPAQESSSQTSAQTTQASQSSDADEYDDVPKTGESNLILWLAAAAVICLGGSYGLKRSAK